MVTIQKIETEFYYNKPQVLTFLILSGLISFLTLITSVGTAQSHQTISGISFLFAILLGLLAWLLWGEYQRTSPVITITDYGIQIARLGPEAIPWYQIEDISFFLAQMDSMIIIVDEPRRWIKPDHIVLELLALINPFQRAGSLSISLVGIKAELPDLVLAIETMKPHDQKFSY